MKADSRSNFSSPQSGELRGALGFLFSLFIFCYLYFLQGEVMAQAQYVYSHGITHYSLLVGALIITLTLQVIQWVVSLLSMLPQRFYALSYLPSAAALVALTDMTESPHVEGALSRWIWIAPTVIVAYILLAILARQMDRLILPDDDDGSLSPIATSNCIILLAIIIGIGSLSRTKDVGFYELKAERLILEKRYDEAARVGEEALATSPRLTELRMYALSRQGKLADRLFCYPQHYASQGLLCVTDTDTIHRVNATTICKYLGAYCGHGIYTGGQYLQLMASDTAHQTPQVADYYLCSLLLDKRTDDFLHALPQLYNLSDTIPHAYDSLPRAYKEALLMMSEEEHALRGAVVIDGDSLCQFADTLYATRYRDYLAMKVGISNKRERWNKTRREFGDTFWWHYDFRKLQITNDK